MKLWHCVNRNFGDALNPWLWNRLLPGFLDRDASTLFVGIGTILDDRVPAEPLKVVFSSGTGYGPPPQLDDRWRFHCVRGPLTASRLGLPADRAVTDGAALLPLVFDGNRQRRRGIAFMPHHFSKQHYDWAPVSRRLGLTYLDPDAPVSRLLEQIASAELVITEAMHGAIVADTLRVPWVAVSIYEHINGFKWDDWCQSMEVSYQPEFVPPLTDNWSQRPDRRLRGYLRRVVATGSLVRMGREDRPVSSPAEVERTADRLAEVRDRSGPILSGDRVLRERTELLRERLAEVLADKNGR